MNYHIEQRFQQLAIPVTAAVPIRAEFQDPLVKSLEGVSLSRLIDNELARFYEPNSENVITRVFRALRRKSD